MGRPVPECPVPVPPHHQFHPPFPQYNKQVSPSRQRRRARRSAAQQASKVTTEEETVEETVLNENDKKKRNLEARNDKETEGNANDIGESTDNFDHNDETIVDTAELVSKATIVPDKVCNDEEYEKANGSNEKKSQFAV